jgi:hydroxymethylpyrimidine/phosphomethylpyrimidine kinase
MRIALTIAGSDSGGGAGVQADLKTFAAHGVYGTSVITGITAQNTTGVIAAQPASSDIVSAQIEAVATDLPPNAVKTGMLPTAAIVEAVAGAIEDLDLPLLVVDPVMVAKSGARLVDEEALNAIRTELMRHAFVVTPNIPEAEVLADMAIRTDEDRREAARRIFALGPSAVIVKGGHLPAADIVDLLYDGHTFAEFRGQRVPGRHTHGTGCTFASAIAARLALGWTLQEAVPLAQEYVAGAIANAPGLGKGHGPVDHFWKSRRS